jgi:hypothetical protein
MMPSMEVKHFHVLRKHLHDSLEVALIEGVGELLVKAWSSFTLMVVSPLM